MTQWLNLSPRTLTSLPSATLLGNILSQGCMMAAADLNITPLHNNIQNLPPRLSLFSFLSGREIFLKIPPGDFSFHLTCQNWGTQVPLNQLQGMRTITMAGLESHDSSYQQGRNREVLLESDHLYLPLHFFPLSFITKVVYLHRRKFGKSIEG